MTAADIKHVARWTPPHYTEPCIKNKDLKLVPDGGVLFWSRTEPIPRRNVTMDVRGTNNSVYFYPFHLFYFIICVFIEKRESESNVKSVF